MKSKYIQDYMQGNICFGCGKDNPEGLRIKSFWENEICICEWENHHPRYQGWKDLMCGGVLATLIDCHTIGTAISHAYNIENRAYDSEPLYMYATGTMKVKYLKPTPYGKKIRLEAKVKEVKGKKTVLSCETWVEGVKTAESEVVAIRVVDTSQSHGNSGFVPYRS